MNDDIGVAIVRELKRIGEALERLAVSGGASQETGNEVVETSWCSLCYSYDCPRPYSDGERERRGEQTTGGL